MSARAALPAALAEHAVCPGRALAPWRSLFPTADPVGLCVPSAGCALTGTPVIDLSLLLSLDLFEFEFSFMSQVVIVFIVPCLSANRAEPRGNGRFTSHIPREANRCSFEEENGAEWGGETHLW